MLTNKLTYRLIAGLLIVTTTIGCSGGGGSALVPSKHTLLPSAEYVRDNGPGPVGAPRELSKTVIYDYILEPGDGLLIEPDTFDSPLQLSLDQIILVDGTIDLGRYGRPVVAGLTIPQVEALIERRIEMVDDNDLPEEAKGVNVRLIDPQSKVYYVLGEVVSPGAYPLRGRETVLDGILNAGGLSDRASTCKIIVSRPTAPPSCRIVLPVCYDQIVQLGDTTTNYQLMPGDRIYVATRSIFEFLKTSEASCHCSPWCHKPQCPCPKGTNIAPPTHYAIPTPVFDESIEPWEIPIAPPFSTPPTGEPVPAPELFQFPEVVEQPSESP